jgi:uncharacterized glyoxalase superfamily protein PhnB
MNEATSQGSAIIASLRYNAAHAAIAWLERVFGFKRDGLYDLPGGTVRTRSGKPRYSSAAFTSRTRLRT